MLQRNFGSRVGFRFLRAATDDFVAGSFLVGFEVLEEKISELASAGIEGGLVGPAVAGNENV